jgi:hypothetical protein
MDLNKVLAELARERELIDEAIAHLERLPKGVQTASSLPRRRGREEKPKEKTRTAGAAFD